MSRTKKPCPGCGGNHPYRPANEVCENCKRALTGWKTYVAGLQRPGSHEEFVKLSEVDYAWPGFYNGANGHGLANFDEHRKGLQERLHELAYRLAKSIYAEGAAPEVAWKAQPLFSVPEHDYPLRETMRSWFRTIALYDEKDIELFGALYDHIAQFSHLCYLSGFDGGRNILIGLASGETSIEELNDTNARLAEKVQQANKRRAYKRPAKRGPAHDKRAL